MKTKNNVQKAILRSGAVIVSFILISLTVSAEDFWRKLITNSSFNEIAIAMVEIPKETISHAGTKTDMINYEVETESALELEQWMIDEFYFVHLAFDFQDEVEVPLRLEDWMLDETYFKPDTITDEPLELESWMFSDAHWNC